MKKRNLKNVKLPRSFKPILWSYDFKKMDLGKNKKTIIVNTINYGDLEHWRWISNYYGKEEIKRIVEEVSVSEIRKRVLPLASLLFSINKLNYEPRGNSERK